MTPLIPIAVVGTGLYLLFRKKPAAPALTAANVIGPARGASPAAPAPVATPQDKADAAIVDEALRTFAQERAFPLEEQRVETRAPASSALGPLATTQGEDIPRQGFDEAPEEESSSLSAVAAAFNPFSPGGTFNPLGSADEGGGEPISNVSEEEAPVQEEPGFFGTLFGTDEE